MTRTASHHAVQGIEVTMSSTAVNPDTESWDVEVPEHVKAAAEHLYVLGVLAARKGTTISYPEAAESLYLAGLGFSYHRSIGQVLDALSRLCLKLHTPDLSSLFWRKDGSIVRWDSLAAKLAEERECQAQVLWPSLVGV
jgi:hypothetical protein